MLMQTFMHVPGVGQVTERKLWHQGFLRWQDYLQRGKRCTLPLLLRSKLAGHLQESEKALSMGHARYFESRLPPAEAWRMYREFRESTAYIDIETTGLYPGADVITVIGLFDGHRTQVFVRDINLDDFADEVKKYSLIVTFNGKRFDVPFLRAVFGELPEEQAHIDLMYPLRRFGYRGGLKSVEVQLGMEREGELKDVDGFLAVLLWREYQRGSKAALDTLIRYNLEDVVNLQYLADTVYNEACTKLPIAVEALPVPTKFEVDMPFDPEVVRYLRRAVGDSSLAHI